MDAVKEFFVTLYSHENVSSKACRAVGVFTLKADDTAE